MRIKFGLILLSCIVLSVTAPVSAQQKGQWVPGQSGLNAGILPDPGFTYANLTINYSADEFKDTNGESVELMEHTVSGQSRMFSITFRKESFWVGNLRVWPCWPSRMDLWSLTWAIPRNSVWTLAAKEWLIHGSSL